MLEQKINSRVVFVLALAGLGGDNGKITARFSEFYSTPTGVAWSSRLEAAFSASFGDV